MKKTILVVAALASLTAFTPAFAQGVNQATSNVGQTNVTRNNTSFGFDQRGADRVESRTDAYRAIYGDTSVRHAR